MYSPLLLSTVFNIPTCHFPRDQLLIRGYNSVGLLSYCECPELFVIQVRGCGWGQWGCCKAKYLKSYSAQFNFIVAYSDALCHQRSVIVGSSNHTPCTTKLLGGGVWLVSLRPSGRPTCRVPSVAPTVLVRCISYLHILSSNCRRCVAHKVSCKFLAIFSNLYLWLCLVVTWDLMWITSMGNHGAGGGISERRHSSCSSFPSPVLFCAS